jgi:hypothetical protein
MLEQQISARGTEQSQRKVLDIGRRYAPCNVPEHRRRFLSPRFHFVEQVSELCTITVEAWRCEGDAAPVCMCVYVCMYICVMPRFYLVKQVSELCRIAVEAWRCEGDAASVCVCVCVCMLVYVLCLVEQVCELCAITV